MTSKRLKFNHLVLNYLQADITENFLTKDFTTIEDSDGILHNLILCKCRQLIFYTISLKQI